MNDSATIAVLYHGPHCPDGYCAAWVAWKKFGASANYFPVNYGDPLPDLSKYSDVYILDFSYPADLLRQLAEMKKVIVLDHHKTAKADLDGLALPNGGFVKFDEDHSGAYMAWQYFFADFVVPPIVKYVQDRDLWKWELPFSKQISAALGVTAKNFEHWDMFNENLGYDDGFQSIKGEGAAILEYIDIQVSNTCKNAFMITIGENIIPCVNTSILQSEIGERLCNLFSDCKFSATFFVSCGGKFVYSLRSRNDFDVSAVAKNFGGGGHNQAAGFTLSGYSIPFFFFRNVNDGDWEKK